MARAAATAGARSVGHLRGPGRRGSSARRHRSRVVRRSSGTTARDRRAPPPEIVRAAAAEGHAQIVRGAWIRIVRGRVPAPPRGATHARIVRDGRAPRRYAPTQPETLYQPSAQPTVAPTTETAAPSVTPVPTASKASALVGVINVIGLTLDNCIATKPIFASGIAGISAKIKL